MPVQQTIIQAIDQDHRPVWGRGRCVPAHPAA